MTMRSHLPTETIECPLCCGEGELSRAEILDRLGVKDFARVAQLSAEEAFRLLQSKHDREHQTAWSRFETELAKRTAEIRERHGEELRMTKSERDDLTRRIDDCLREVAQLRERNQELEGEMSKAARRGKLEEMSFEEQARTWAGIAVSAKLPKNGDFLLAYRDPSGAAMEPQIIVDNKDKASVTEVDFRKLIRDAKERRCPAGIIVARDESQLRQQDREQRRDREDGVWILRTTRAWLPRDLEVLKPVFERCAPRVPISSRETPRWQRRSGARLLNWTRSRRNWLRLRRRFNLSRRWWCATGSGCKDSATQPPTRRSTPSLIAISTTVGGAVHRFRSKTGGRSADPNGSRTSTNSRAMCISSPRP